MDRPTALSIAHHVVARIERDGTVNIDAVADAIFTGACRVDAAQYLPRLIHQARISDHGFTTDDLRQCGYALNTETQYWERTPAVADEIVAGMVKRFE